MQFIEGLVRTVADENYDYGTNSWVAVVVNGEWRLVDVFFAVEKESKTDRNWELIDDGGQVYCANYRNLFLRSSWKRKCYMWLQCSCWDNQRSFFWTIVEFILSTLLWVFCVF